MKKSPLGRGADLSVGWVKFPGADFIYSVAVRFLNLSGKSVRRKLTA
jgi:hypothetical protein